MTALTIKTNNQPRELKSIHDFSPAEQVKVREHFDWMDTEELETSYSFFKYRDNFYHLSRPSSGSHYGHQPRSSHGFSDRSKLN